MGKVLVLLSGGMDSTTLAALCAKEHGAENIVGLFVSYGQKHLTRECEASLAVATALKLGEWATLTIPDELLHLEGSALTGEAEMPEVPYSELEGLSPSYVPFRNGILTSLACAAALQRECDFVALAVHADDGANWAYPDCTPEFVGAMANAVYVGSYFKVRLLAPLVHFTKAEIAIMSAKLDAPQSLSWSCYNGGEIHCGTCPTCRSRKEAFAIAGLADPTRYMEE